MNRSARECAREADVVVFVTDVPQTRGDAALRVHPGDVALLGDIGVGTKTVLVLNKVDRQKNKGALLPLLAELSKLRAFEAIVPVSALRADGVERVLEEVAKLLPEGPHAFGEDDVTDKPARWFVSEYVREQVLLLAREEVPHATAVTVESYDESGRTTRVAATLHVERTGHKKILVGTGGEMLKRIGTEARKRIEQLVGRGIFLELFVRVTPGWREGSKLLSEFGYGSPSSETEIRVELSESSESSLPSHDEDDLNEETP
jgi:GTP-binding protein Era